MKNSEGPIWKKAVEVHCLTTEDTWHMARTISPSTRAEYLEMMRCRYPRYVGKPARSKLLDEFCRITE